LYTLVTAATVAAGVAGTWRGARECCVGTEGDESNEWLLGDGLVPAPRVQSTRAITIDAPPEQVWPWIVQMAIGRAGFYTHDSTTFRVSLISRCRSRSRGYRTVKIVFCARPTSSSAW
jgi:hypothetical protein